MNDLRASIAASCFATVVLPCFLALACGDDRLRVGFGPPTGVAGGGRSGEGLGGAGSGGAGSLPMGGTADEPPSDIGGESGGPGIATLPMAGGAGIPAGGSSGGMPVETGCGDGVRDDSEECDDGNQASDDGCSNDCGVEAGFDCSGLPEVPCNRSCAGTDGTECMGESCCASPIVTGGTFEQWGELTEELYESTVSSFRLDQFEVTVARFRSFLADRAAWKAAGNPALGAGANPHIEGSGWPGWGNDVAYEDVPPTCREDSDPGPTWVETGNDTLPISCVSWYAAFEFCVWDGGRLPTQAEWEFAAAGGSLQRRYPWGNEPELTEEQDATAAYAVYGSLGDGSAPNESSPGDILPIGSRPLGAGAFGQQDLAGSMMEWLYDPRPAMDPTMPVTDFAVVAESTLAGTQGGSWRSPARELENDFTVSTLKRYQLPDVGFRCARNP